MIILFSAGNSGVDADANGYVDQDSIGSPGTAKNCITSGASDNERTTGGYNPGGPCSTWYECWGSDYPTNPTRDDRISDTRQELAAFSSRGPTDDGRIKPDVVAPGTNILSTRSQYASETGWGTYPNNYYMYMGGTSMSNPLIAGAATLVREYYVEKKGHTPSAALVKAALINSATDITGYGNSSQEAGQPIPNNHEGWGLVNVGAATSATCPFHDGDTVTTGSNQTYSYSVGSSAQPFKVTLVWSDYPGSPPAGGLVNNLNLVVTGPGGTTYRGNVFSGGWSVPGGTADSVNNVESVYVQNPAVGTWTVRVEGANVPQGPQPFALVARGWCGAAPSHWVYLPIVLRSYGAPAAPTLNSISNPDGDGNYTVSWSASSGATGYTLQEDDNASFTSPTTAYSGAATSTNISGKGPGTYYYRVNASNSYGTSGWSNVQSVVVAGLTGPTPGFWQEDDTYGCAGCSEFYVTSDSAYVDDFAIYVYVQGCGSYKITHITPEPITSNHFSFGTTYYASGTFSNPTTCSGTYGLSNFYIGGCGYVSGGPWDYRSVWKHAEVVAGAGGPGPVTVEKVEDGGVHHFLTATLESDTR